MKQNQRQTLGKIVWNDTRLKCMEEFTRVALEELKAIMFRIDWLRINLISFISETFEVLNGL